MPKKRSSSELGDYKIGYRRPPKQYQFKRGRIPNPDGINQHDTRSIARDMKLALEGELNKQIKIRQGKRSITVRQTTAGISQLVRQYVEGNPRARRDLILLCEKLGVALIDRDALRGALEDVLSAEDEALLADFVRRHGGQYPIRPDMPADFLAEAEPLGRPVENSKLLTAQSKKSTEPQTSEREKSHE